MSRARNIKPGFFTNDVLAQCEYGARLVFVGLWCIADRDGRLEDRPLRIKALTLPFDKCDINKFLDQLVQHGFIVRYETGDGHKYIQVKNFLKHQHPHVKEPASTIPAPDSPGAKTSDCGLRIADSGLLIPDSLIPPKPRRVLVERSYTEEFSKFWKLYPPIRKGSKPLAWEAWQKAIERATAETILAAAETFAASPLANSKYCPGPTPWLNQDRWDDDQESWQRGNDGPVTGRLPTAEEQNRWNGSTGIR